jgi:hypothetical protein
MVIRPISISSDSIPNIFFPAFLLKNRNHLLINGYSTIPLRRRQGAFRRSALGGACR